MHLLLNGEATDAMFHSFLSTPHTHRCFSFSAVEKILCAEEVSGSRGHRQHITKFNIMNDKENNRRKKKNNMQKCCEVAELTSLVRFSIYIQMSCQIRFYFQFPGNYSYRSCQRKQYNIVLKRCEKIGEQIRHFPTIRSHQVHHAHSPVAAAKSSPHF
uniref:Integumentary mucin C.1-like n=1 Tax=Parascaris univalens TaxID=6257 RepID=A0A915AW80_PARUN